MSHDHHSKLDISFDGIPHTRIGVKSEYYSVLYPKTRLFLKWPEAVLCFFKLTFNIFKSAFTLGYGIGRIQIHPIQGAVILNVIMSPKLFIFRQKEGMSGNKRR